MGGSLKNKQVKYEREKGRDEEKKKGRGRKWRGKLGGEGKKVVEK